MKKALKDLFQDITETRDVPEHLGLSKELGVRIVTIRRIGFNQIRDLLAGSLLEKMDRFGPHWDGMVKRQDEETEKERVRVDAAKAKAEKSGEVYHEPPPPEDDDEQQALANYPHFKTLTLGLTKLGERHLQQHEFKSLGEHIDQKSAEWLVLEILDFNGLVHEDEDAAEEASDATETDTATESA